MKNSFQNRRAETILEVIIAVTVIMVILAPASALYIASIRTAGVNRNDLVAAALAEEGIEIVRNIRDTNFIKFSDNVSNCWNTVPNYSGNDCAGNKIATGTYRLAVDIMNGNLALNPAAEALTDDLSGANDGEYRLTLDAGIHLYYHAPPPAPGVAPPDPSPFYREVAIEYQNSDMYATSRVLYRTGTAIRQITSKVILTNE